MKKRTKTVWIALSVALIAAALVTGVTFALFSTSVNTEHYISTGELRIDVFQTSMTGNQINTDGTYGEYPGSDEEISLRDFEGKVFDIQGAAPGIHRTGMFAVRDAGSLGSPRYVFSEGREQEYADGFFRNAAPLEFSPHATWDKRGAPVILRGGNGGFETDFRYESYQIAEGLPSLEGLPHAHGKGAETLIFTLREKTYAVTARLYLSIFADKDILLKHVEIENASQAPAVLTRAMSMQLDLPSADYDLVHFCGRWAKERDYCENSVLDGVQEISSNLGRSSAEENPFVFLKARGADEAHGEVIGFNLVYSGNFKFRTFVGMYRGLHVTYGINDEDFEWTLPAGGICARTRGAAPIVPCCSIRGKAARSTSTPRASSIISTRPSASAPSFSCSTTVGSARATTTCAPSATGR